MLICTKGGTAIIILTHLGHKSGTICALKVHQRGTRGVLVGTFKTRTQATKGHKRGVQEVNEEVHERSTRGALKWKRYFFILAHLGHGWDTDAKAAQELHERGTRGAREGHKRFTRGAREVHGWDTDAKAIQELHEMVTRGAREGHKRGVRERHERVTRGVLEVHERVTRGASLNLLTTHYTNILCADTSLYDQLPQTICT